MSARWRRRGDGVPEPDDEVLVRLNAVEDRLARMAADLAEAARHADQRHRDLCDVLYAIRSNEALNRERLYALRGTPGYVAAFDDPNPLVSVIIPTYDRVQPLLERALPSVFQQTHANLEVIVVTDGAPDHVVEALAGVGDPRLRCIHLPTRGPYPHEPEKMWFVKGSPPANAGLMSAGGHWISPFSDDDVLRPTAIEQVLEVARSGRFEVCYGQIEWQRWDGSTRLVGEFPPRLSAMALQGGIIHSGLRFVQHELSDAALRIPNDWSMVDRLLRLGVRVGFLEDVVAEWHQGPHPHDDPQLTEHSPAGSATSRIAHS